MYRLYLRVRLPYFCDSISNVTLVGNSYNHMIVRKDVESEIRDKEEAEVTLRGKACGWGLADPEGLSHLCPGLA